MDAYWGRAWRWGGAFAAAGWAVACGSNSGAGAGMPSDGGGVDVTIGEASADAALDAGAEAEAGVPEAAAPCHHELTNPNCWSGLDIGRATDLSNSFFGAAFDGRYVYVVSNSSGAEVDQTRVDPQATGGDPFEIFNTYTQTVEDVGPATAGFDGRYIYYVPNIARLNIPGNTIFNFDSVVARYDTQGAFASSLSWSTYDMTTGGPIDGGPSTADGGVTTPGYLGAVFDGRYMYFVPVGGALGPSGLVARYDTTAPFGAQASWSTFDMANVDPRARGFAGGTFDGRYVYFSPYNNGIADAGAAQAGGLDGVVGRFDTQGDFDAGAAWTTFDTSALDPNAAGYNGAVFDGRYVYFVPYSGNDVGFGCVVARYDTQAAFDAGAAWTTFDTSPLNPDAFGDSWSYQGGVFDGRYVYYVPTGNSPLLRLDTQGSFTDPDAGAWTTFDMGAAGSTFLGSYSGGVFDGQYVWLVPDGYNPLARFDARDAGPLPDGSLRSFF